MVAAGQVAQSRSRSPGVVQRGLQLAGNRGLIESGSGDLRRRREEFAAELTEAVRLVQVVRGMALHDERKAARGRQRVTDLQWLLDDVAASPEGPR